MHHDSVVGWTTHHAIVEHKGRWYIFHHDCVPSGGKTWLRSLKVAELEYDDEGRIKTIDGGGSGMNKLKSLILAVTAILTGSTAWAYDGSCLWLSGADNDNQAVITVPKSKSPTVAIAAEELNKSWHGEPLRLEIKRDKHLGNEGFRCTATRKDLSCRPTTTLACSTAAMPCFATMRPARRLLLERKPRLQCESAQPLGQS